MVKRKMNTLNEIETFFDTLDSVCSIHDAIALCEESKQDLEAKMALFLSDQDPGAFQRRKTCAKKIRNLKQRIHPLQTDPEALALIKKYNDSKTSDQEKRALQTKYVHLSQHLMKSENGISYTRVVGLLDRLLAPVLKMDHGAGRSNRARRAKAASNVLSRNAGLSGAISGDSASGTARGDTNSAFDHHGNRIGSEWDLGRDGAYDGLKVVVIQEYNGEGFTGELPVSALREKGFEVSHKVVTSQGDLPSTEELDLELSDASQVWLISGPYSILTEEHLATIVRHWLNGLGVYIFGDNEPYFIDANRLLAMMAQYLNESRPPSIDETSDVSSSSSVLKLSGDTLGDEIVGARQATSSSSAGFIPDHLLVTGLTRLYEGVTVSSMEKDVALAQGFEEVLYEHTGVLVVAARKAVRGQGPIIVDGAFTKLYCHWEMGGSARFVRNCACWLSTLLDEDDCAINDSSTSATEIEAEECIELNMDGAFECECSISAETGPIALLASRPGDEDINTTDFALDNNLALARKNLVMSSQPLSAVVAKIFLQQGINPFTRSPVAAIVPMVKLSDKGNMKLVSEIACQLFMGGREMKRHALNILLSVCEEMLHREPDCSQALVFFIRELLRNAVSTPDMLKGTPGGPTVPLEQGLRANITITGELVPLRKAFTHVGCIVRLLALHASEPRLPTGTLFRVARRSLIKTIIGVIGKVARTETNGGQGEPGEELTRHLDGLMFDNQLGIPIGGTAKLVALPQMREMVNKILHYTNMNEILLDVQRIVVALTGQDGTLVSDSELTSILLLLRPRAPELWKTLIEPLLVQLKEKDLQFRNIWEAQSIPNEADESAKIETALQQANAQLTGTFAMEPSDHARVPWPGFATPFGPSVYRCKCGFEFGNPQDNLDDSKVSQKLKETRNKHFQAMFGADQNGYPTATSAHFPLHRAVQRVLTTAPFNTMTKRTEEMEWEVAKMLQLRKKGNIHVPTIQGDIRYAIDTYLNCRIKGMAEPSPGFSSVDFLVKAKLEQKLILESRATRNELWIDPQRIVG